MPTIQKKMSRYASENKGTANRGRTGHPLAVQAQRKLPILRGEVLERVGGRRPDCVFDK